MVQKIGAGVAHTRKAVGKSWVEVHNAFAWWSDFVCVVDTESDLGPDEIKKLVSELVRLERLMTCAMHSIAEIRLSWRCVLDVAEAVQEKQSSLEAQVSGLFRVLGVSEEVSA
jgi:predicted trehalose synthase